MSASQSGHGMRTDQVRFWSVVGIAIVTAPFLAWQLEGEFDSLMVAMSTLVSMVVASWFAEAVRLSGWQPRVAVWAIGASIACSFLPWTPPLAAWLLTLGYVTLAVANKASANVAETTAERAVDAQDESTGQSSGDVHTAGELSAEVDDPHVVASLVRRRVDETETVEGLVAAVAAGPTHVVFHPPFAATPSVEIHALDECNPRVAETTPYGLRINTSQPGRIVFTASAPAA